MFVAYRYCTKEKPGTQQLCGFSAYFLAFSEVEIVGFEHVKVRSITRSSGTV